jgi:hypothetical protein
MPATVDPFTFIYQRLWSVFTGYQPWMAEVFAIGGSLLRFDENDYPPNLDQEPGANKSPMVCLFPGRQVVNPFSFDAAATTMTLSHPLVIIHENLSIQKPNRVKWASLQALSAAGLQMGIPRLVQKVTINSSTDQISAGMEQTGSQGKGHRRITTLWTIDVACWIKTSLVATGDYESTL